jgi:hypothetical protein
VDSTDEALVAEYRAVVSKHFRHLLYHTAVDAQITAASFRIPFQVQLLQLCDIHQPCLKVLVGALIAATCKNSFNKIFLPIVCHLAIKYAGQQKHYDFCRPAHAHAPHARQLIANMKLLRGSETTAHLQEC